MIFFQETFPPKIHGSTGKMDWRLLCDSVLSFHSYPHPHPPCPSQHLPEPFSRLGCWQTSDANLRHLHLMFAVLRPALSTPGHLGGHSNSPCTLFPSICWVFLPSARLYSEHLGCREEQCGPFSGSCLKLGRSASVRVTAVNPRSAGREHQVRTCLGETLKVLQQVPPVPTHPPSPP